MVNERMVNELEHNTVFDLSEQARQELELRLNALLQVCQIYHVPMFASVATKNSDEGTEYRNIVYSAQAHDMKLQEDHIRKYILIADGFEPVPPREVISNDIFGIAQGVANNDRA